MTDSESRQEPEPKKTRVRLPAPRKQLAVTLQRMEKLVQSETLKEAKVADLLMEMGRIQTRFLDIERDEKHTALVAENQRLRNQHIEDAEEIARLRGACRIGQHESFAAVVAKIGESNAKN
jgi:hypothetical protein